VHFPGGLVGALTAWERKMLETTLHAIELWLVFNMIVTWLLLRHAGL
jgi:hypothetical protein